jgi:alkylation response protein AidB-like acyl-CoA dehydrogenase
MLLTPSPDQAVLRETTQRFLDEHVPTPELRRLRGDPTGFDREYWRRGTELGWTSLLVDEEHGGGSVSGAPVTDLTLIAYEFGRHAAPGPLLGNNVVAAALSTAADGPGTSHLDVVGEILAGRAVAAWCAPDVDADRARRSYVQVASRGADVVLDGTVRPVEFAAQSDHLLVTGSSDGARTQVLVPTRAPGVTVVPMETVDLSRRFGAVSLDGVRLPASALVGEVGKADEAVERQLQLALAVLNAEAVGAMQAAFDMTVEWSFDRYTFGRPLASYQAIKHRFADMLSWLEASHAVSDAAAAAVDAGSADAAELASVAKAYIGEQGVELLHECVQIHGGIGITFEHDLHLFLRRMIVNRGLAGTPAEHRQRIATMVEQREETPG